MAQAAVSSLKSVSPSKTETIVRHYRVAEYICKVLRFHGYLHGIIGDNIIAVAGRRELEQDLEHFVATEAGNRKGLYW